MISARKSTRRQAFDWVQANNHAHGDGAPPAGAAPPLRRRPEHVLPLGAGARLSDARGAHPDVGRPVSTSRARRDCDAWLRRPARPPLRGDGAAAQSTDPAPGPAHASGRRRSAAARGARGADPAARQQRQIALETRLANAPLGGERLDRLAAYVRGTGSSARLGVDAQQAIGSLFDPAYAATPASLTAPAC